MRPVLGAFNRRRRLHERRISVLDRNNLFMYVLPCFGEIPEWSKGADCKSVG